jgi:tetratricopeptide (TPR) repeat protein
LLPSGTCENPYANTPRRNTSSQTADIQRQSTAVLEPSSSHPSKRFVENALTDAENAGHPATAVILARELLQIAPEDGLTWVQLGKALGYLSNYGEAEFAFQNALKYCKESQLYLAYLCMGHAWKRRGDYEEALRSCRVALDLMPHDAERYTYVGSMLQKQGKLAEAEEVHRAGTECKEGCIDEAYHFRGLALRCQGRLDEARECFEKAISLDHDYSDAKEALTDVLAAIAYQKSFE